MDSFIVTVIGQLADINELDKAIYRERFQEKIYRKGEHFLCEGQVCRHMGVIEYGIMRTYIKLNGEEPTFDFITNRGFLSNYESFITKKPSVRYIQALEDTKVHVATFENFEYFYLHTQSGERVGRLVLGRAFIKLQNELTSFYTNSPEQRYEKFLTMYPHLQQRISQYYIASYVGVKPPSLSRIRRRIL